MKKKSLFGSVLLIFCIIGVMEIQSNTSGGINDLIKEEAVVFAKYDKAMKMMCSPDLIAYELEKVELSYTEIYYKVNLYQPKSGSEMKKLKALEKVVFASKNLIHDEAEYTYLYSKNSPTDGDRKRMNIMEKNLKFLKKTREMFLSQL